MSGILSTADMAGALAATRLKPQAKWAKSVGIDERVWRGIRAGEYAPAKAASRIADEYRSTEDVFWSAESNDAVELIRSTDDLVRLQTLLHQSFTLEVAELTGCGPPDIRTITDPGHYEDPAQDHFGRSYKWAIYASRIARNRLAALKRKEALDGFVALTEQLLKCLQGMDQDSPTVKALTFRLEWDRFTMQFECMARKDRGSAQWRQRLEETRFFATAFAYNDRVPHAWQFPWTALAFASCLGMRELYGDLVRRLLRTRKFDSVEDIMNHPKFDKDFSDVADWLTQSMAAE